MANGVVILGGGHAGAAAAAALRTDGYDGPIRLVSAEEEIPYQKPPLSKAFLKEPDSEPMPIRPQAFYDTNHVDLDLGTLVTAIDRTAGALVAADGRRIPFDGLILAMGARVRTVDAEGADLSGVSSLRSTADARILRERLAAARSVVVVGGGFIGLEVAATAALLGKAVTVLEAGPRLMGRAVAPEVSAFMLERHRAAGVDVRLQTALGRFIGFRGELTAVEPAGGGAPIPADLALVGIGVLPNVELAAEAGLEVAGGIVVDPTMRTADPRIVACGDAVAFESVLTGSRVRIESVQNATDQARHAVLALLGKPSVYRQVPWFWSDQGPIKLQMVGLSHGADRTVLRGRPEDGRFSVFHFRGDRLVAIDSVDRPADHMIGRRLLAAETALTPDQAGDESVDLKALAGAPAR